MKRSRLLVLLTPFFLVAQSLRAEAESIACDAHIENCWGRSNASDSSAAYPSTSAGFRLNPSAVPVTKQYGGELIYFNQQFDPSLVHGDGRIGESVSLQNGEESFFGAPSFESSPEYLQRKESLREYRSQKISVAGAISLYDNKKDDLRHLQLNLGVQVQYNHVLNAFLPGTGITGIVGPFSFGVSYALDEELINNQTYGLGADQVVHSTAVTYSLGLYLSLLALDYSLLQVRPQDELAAELGPTDVSLFTASLLLNKWTLTASYRTELSNRLAYDFTSKSLFVEHSKQEIFGGVQFAPISQVILGCYYNYYLLREISVGTTIFL